MIAGFDRYYQIVKCFRDEDLRADRQPEFTQIDIETSFLNEFEIREMFENLIRSVFKKCLDVNLVADDARFRSCPMTRLWRALALTSQTSV